MQNETQSADHLLSIDYSVFPETFDDWIEGLTGRDDGSLECVPLFLRPYAEYYRQANGEIRAGDIFQTPYSLAKFGYAFDLKAPRPPWHGTGAGAHEARIYRHGIRLQIAEFIDGLAAWYRKGTPQYADLYFIGGDVGPIKIGVSQAPEKRVKQLQTGYPYALRLMAVVRGGCHQEPVYHDRFAAHRLNGEWFERHPDILAEIERLSA